FFFADHDDYFLEKVGTGVVWNKATFIVCHPTVLDKRTAHCYVYQWLGWLDAPGMNKRAKDAAINHLIVSAIGEALKRQQEKQRLKQMLTIMGASGNNLQEFSFQDDGQMILVI